MDREQIIEGIMKDVRGLDNEALEALHNQLSEGFAVRYVGDDYFELGEVTA